MTENEIKNTKEWFEDFIETYALSNQETIEFKKAVACLEELQQYRAIGTVDEFKVLKDDAIPIIHGKAELELHDKEIRAKAIDEFAEKLITHISQMPSGYIGSGNVLIIAEQLKAGGKNE